MLLDRKSSVSIRASTHQWPHVVRIEEIDKKLERKKKKWRILPPENMNIILHQDMGALPGGVVLSVPHEVGRYMLMHRTAAIIDHEVTVDAVIDGSYEDILGAMGIGLS